MEVPGASGLETRERRDPGSDTPPSPQAPYQGRAPQPLPGCGCASVHALSGRREGPCLHPLCLLLDPQGETVGGPSRLGIFCGPPL